MQTKARSDWATTEDKLRDKDQIEGKSGKQD